MNNVNPDCSFDGTTLTIEITDEEDSITIDESVIFIMKFEITIKNPLEKLEVACPISAMI